MTKNRIITWDANDDITDLVDELNAVIVSSGDITDADAQKVWDEAMTEIG
jgi:hypothetical protein